MVDDAGLPSTSGEGWIVAVPKTEGLVWLRRQDADIDDHNLDTAAVKLDLQRVVTLGGDVAHIDGGRFILDVKPGAYLFCHMSPEAAEWTTGCSTATLAAGDQIESSSHVGGFGVEAD